KSIRTKVKSIRIKVKSIRIKVISVHIKVKSIRIKVISEGSSDLKFDSSILEQGTIFLKIHGKRGK
ncbi:MAG: hypothetical protein WCJ01_06445, partial [Ignavibacteria bacterium]